MSEFTDCRIFFDVGYFFTDQNSLLTNIFIPTKFFTDEYFFADKILY